VVEVDRPVGERAPPGVLELAIGAQVDDRGDPQGLDPVDVRPGQLMEAVAAEQRAPPGDPVGASRVAPEVAEVERPGQGDQTGSRLHAPIMVDAEARGDPGSPKWARKATIYR
jgi:hypothetical protein